MATAMKVDTQYCQHCGASLRIEDLFCANCGSPVPEHSPRSGRDGTGRRAAPWSEPDAWAPAGGKQDPTWWEEPLSQRSPIRYPSSELVQPEVSTASRLWAATAPMGIILGAFMSAGLLSFVVPLMIWQLRKGTDPFAAEHGREATNAVLSLFVYAIIGVIIAIPVTLVTLGVGLLVMFFAAGVIGLVFLVSLIVATIRALNSQPFRYPLMIRFFKG
ncbi:MAG TPA: DUF4870 domain-containing protein [Thermomicrobiales bacterium]|jgi:hypothetical protein|nr:DUF4870 domain-containing protein [Thermomicrobiales bacterium]